MILRWALAVFHTSVKKLDAEIPFHCNSWTGGKDTMVRLFVKSLSGH